jgi:hypothetical protein
MALSLRALFVCIPFLDLRVNNAQQNPAGNWVADFTPGVLNYVTVDAFTTLGTPVVWAIACPGAAPVGAPNPADATQFRIPTNNPTNVVDAANTIWVTATAAGIVRTVEIVIKPVVNALLVVPDHFTFQDNLGANYALDLSGIADRPPAVNLTSNLQVQTVPANAAAWSHIVWGAVNLTAGGAGYALTPVDGQTRGIRLDGVKTVRTTVGMLDTAQPMPAAVDVTVRVPANGAALANGLAVTLQQFSFAGLGRFDVMQEDAANFNVAYPAGWDPGNNTRPQAYTANTAIATHGVTLSVGAVPAANTNVTLRATAVLPLANGNLSVLQGNVGPQPVAAGTAVGTPVAMGNIALGNTPNEVVYTKPMMIFWEVSDDGGTTWSPLRVTANTTYVTARAPVATTDPALNNGIVYTYDSLLAMSCQAAEGIAGGAGTAAAVQTAIADLFNPANPNARVQRLNRAAGGGPTQLGYWLTNDPAQSLNGPGGLLNGGGGNMFTNPIGNLACGVWAEMLIMLWALHGKGDGRFISVEVRGPALHLQGLPGTPNVVQNSRFNVRNWSYNNLPNVDPVNYTHAILAPVGAALPPVGPINQAASVTNGAAGQNNLNPPESFVNHFIVRDGIAGNFYDPSYGTPGLARDAWVDASLGGLRNDDTNAAGFVTAVPAQPNGIQTNHSAVALYDVVTPGWVP